MSWARSRAPSPRSGARLEPGDAAVAALDKEIEELGRQQEELGRQQEELGRQQEELGRQQERLGNEAETKFRGLVDDALRTGKAREVGR